MEFQSVTVLIGTTDEADLLTQTVQTLLCTCNKDDLKKILIVRSKTATPACVQAACALEEAYPDIIENMIQTRPYVGGAIQDGFDTAETSHILLLPADLAIGLDAVPKMIETEKLFPDGIAKTSRWMRRGSFHNYPKRRKALNHCAQIFLRMLFHTHLTDLTNPVQIMPTELYRSFRWQELHFPFLLELVLIPVRFGIPFHEIAADCFDRKEGRSKNSFLQTALFLRTALRIRFSAKRSLRKESH